MTIAITGATGQLGGLVVDALLDREISASDLVAVVRTPSKAGRLAERGVEVREASYTDGDTLEKALSGVDKLLLVSGSEVGQRLGSPRAEAFHADAYLAGVEKLAALGVTWLQVGLPGDSLAHVIETIERFGSSVIQAA